MVSNSSKVVKTVKIKKPHNRKFELLDVFLITILTAWGLIIFIPFLNSVVISFSSYEAYLSNRFMLFPIDVDLSAYKQLLEDARIAIGYRTTLIFVFVGVPINLFMTSTIAYGLSRRGYPGRKLIFFAVLFTMLFNGGIVPTYLLMMALGLRDTIMGVILVTCMNSFYMILMYNYFNSIPESLIESAMLDGSSEWGMLFRIIIPLSKPIFATIILFSAVDRWNEWFSSMIYTRSSNIQPLQLALRSIVIDSVIREDVGNLLSERTIHTMGIKMAAVMITMIPIMCVFPFLQKHFAKGIMMGAIKA